MRLVWTARARRDLLEIGRYIRRDSPTAARRWVLALRRRAEETLQLPGSGRVVPELGRDEIQEIIHRNYRIVYRVREESIEILTVFEGHKRLPADL